jgi:AraC family transcriptional regulator
MLCVRFARYYCKNREEIAVSKRPLARTALDRSNAGDQPPVGGFTALVFSKDRMQSPTAIGNQFRLKELPAFLALKAPKSPISICRMRSGPVLERTLPPPKENAYSLHVFMASVPRADQWLDNVYSERPAVMVGQSLLFHWGQQPSVVSNMPFDVIRFGISQDALEEVAHEHGLNRIEELRLQNSGVDDAVMYGLAQALAPAIDRPEQVSALFVDHIAMAFFVHIADTYGHRPISGHLKSYGLAPWQLRRAKDNICSNIEGDPSLASLAQECGLSPSQFSRAFKQSTGTTPHQWLTAKRIERAKELLRSGDLDLVEVSLACGFHDQSHFTRVFAQSEGDTPGRWRRLYRT